MIRILRGTPEPAGQTPTPDPHFESGERIVWAPQPIAGTVVRSIELDDRRVYVVNLDGTGVITCGPVVLKREGAHGDLER